jgi:hypothetical protein
VRQSAPADFRPARKILRSARWAEDFSATSGTIFAFHKLPLRLYPAAVILFANAVQGRIHVDGVCRREVAIGEQVYSDPADRRPQRGTARLLLLLLRFFIDLD